MLKLRINVPAFAMFEFGRTYTFRIYNEDETEYNASATGPQGVLLVPVVKLLKRPGDKALFFRDVAKALEIIRNVAQIVADITGTFTTAASGVGTWAWTVDKRPGVSGKSWVQIVLVDSILNPTMAIPTELIPVQINPSVSVGNT